MGVVAPSTGKSDAPRLRQRLRVALLIAMILVPRPNIARALVANGGAARVVLLSGGAEGAQLADLLSSLGIKVVNVPVLGAVGANVSIVKPDGTVTKINEPGPGAGLTLNPGTWVLQPENRPLGSCREPFDFPELRVFSPR